jgi:hypothetical protein
MIEDSSSYASSVMPYQEAAQLDMTDDIYASDGNQFPLGSFDSANMFRCFLGNTEPQTFANTPPQDGRDFGAQSECDDNSNSPV